MKEPKKAADEIDEWTGCGGGGRPDKSDSVNGGQKALPFPPLFLFGRSIFVFVLGARFMFHSEQPLDAIETGAKLLCAASVDTTGRVALPSEIQRRFPLDRVTKIFFLDPLHE